MKKINIQRPKKGPRSNNPDSAGAVGKVIIFNVNKPTASKLPVHPKILLKLVLFAMLMPNKNQAMVIKMSKATS